MSTYIGGFCLSEDEQTDPKRIRCKFCPEYVGSNLTSDNSSVASLSTSSAQSSSSSSGSSVGSTTFVDDLKDIPIKLGRVINPQFSYGNVLVLKKGEIRCNEYVDVVGYKYPYPRYMFLGTISDKLKKKIKNIIYDIEEDTLHHVYCSSIEHLEGAGVPPADVINQAAKALATVITAIQKYKTHIF